MNEGFCPKRPESRGGNRTQTGQDVSAGPVLLNRHHAKPFTLVDTFYPHNNPEVGPILISKIKSEAQGLTVGKPQIQDPNPGVWLQSLCD